MSFVQGKWLEDGRLLGFCGSCGKEVGVLDKAELRHVLTHHEGLWCFDCDQIAANRIPDVLYSNDLVYFVRLGEQWFSVNWPNLAGEGRRRIAYYQSITDELFERLQASYLSSTPNLHATALEPTHE